MIIIPHVFHGGPETMTDGDAKTIATELATGQTVEICFRIYRPLSQSRSFDQDRRMILAALKKKLAAASAPYCELQDINRFDSNRTRHWGIWLVIQIPPPALKFSAGPETLDQGDLFEISEQLKERGQVTLQFRIRYRGQLYQFPWEPLALTLDAKLKSFGIKHRSVHYTMLNPDASRSWQVIRVTIHQKLLELPPHSQ